MNRDARGRGASRCVPYALLVASIPLLAAAEAGLEYIRTLQGRSPNHFWWMFRHDLPAWSALVVLVPAVAWLARRFPLVGPTWRRSLLVHFAGGMALATAHLALDTLIVSAWRGERLPVLAWTAYLLSWYALRDVFLYWALVALLQVVWHQKSMREQELREATLRADLADARLAALQAQLEPHFLFNALNTAVMMVRSGERESAVDVLLELTELLRAVVDREPRSLVPLSEEYRFVERYLALAKARFPDRLSVDLHCAGEAAGVPVPFLILQPLIENAVVHGVAPVPGPGRVVLRARLEHGSLLVDVEDSGPGLSADAGEGVGLTNVRGRLQALYGGRASLVIGTAPGGGTLSRLVLPV